MVLGYPKLSPKEVLSNVRKYEGKFDYTKVMSDDELLSVVSRHVEYSKEFEEECKNLVLQFYDTSYNRNDVLIHIIDKIVGGENF